MMQLSQALSYKTPTMLISVIVTNFRDNFYLNKLLLDLSKQDFDKKKLEILLLDAGNYQEKEAKKWLGSLKNNLRFWSVSNLPRTSSLNFLIKNTKANLIVRLDSRSHISKNYLSQIYKLSAETKAANVGGSLRPVGLNYNQNMIAKIMQHPLSFGGAKFRSLNYRGEVDSLYLGAFNRKLMPKGSWFDEELVKISEDSDLNYRIKKSNQKIILDSSIVVGHYPRESLKSFFKLCYNYGLGRGLFLIKHKTVSAFRQLVLPLGLLLTCMLFYIGFFIQLAHEFLLLLILIYVSVLCVISYKLSNTMKES
jgi:succinoglycan biosynthesis protein ExoA